MIVTGQKCSNISTRDTANEKPSLASKTKRIIPMIIFHMKRLNVGEGILGKC